MQKTLEFKQKEEVYINQIASLEIQVKNQSLQLHGIRSQNNELKREKTELQQLLRENKTDNTYKEEVIKLEFQLNEQLRELSRLTDAKIKWRAEARQKESTINQQLQRIKELEKESSGAYRKLGGIGRTESPLRGIMKSWTTNTSKRSVNTSKRSVITKFRHPRDNNSGSELSRMTGGTGQTPYFANVSNRNLGDSPMPSLDPSEKRELKNYPSDREVNCYINGYIVILSVFMHCKKNTKYIYIYIATG